PDCNGDGVSEKGTDDERQCPTCGGKGFVPDDDEDEEVIRSATGLGVSSRTVQTAEDLAQNADRMGFVPQPSPRLPSSRLPADLLRGLCLLHELLLLCRSFCLNGPSQGIHQIDHG